MAKVQYKLTRPFWNGKRLIPVGSVEYFEEGEAPKSAKSLEAPKVEEPAVEPAVDEPAQEPAALSTKSEPAKKA